MNYCDLEWFALETNWDLCVFVFKVFFIFVVVVSCMFFNLGDDCFLLVSAI